MMVSLGKGQHARNSDRTTVDAQTFDEVSIISLSSLQASETASLTQKRSD